MNNTTKTAKHASNLSTTSPIRDTDIVDQFCRAMREQDISVNPSDIVADGKFHRVHVEDDRKGSKNGFYVLHLDGLPSGAFGCNRRYGNKHKFKWSAEKSSAPLTPVERRAWRDEMTRRRLERDGADRATRAAAAEEANRIWDGAQDATEHPYLTRKGIKGHGLRVGTWEKVNDDGEVCVISKNALLVPIRDTRKQIHSLQAILPNAKNALARDKDYLTGGAKEGLFYSIGKPVLSVDGKLVILICEGYATGASLHEATGHAVIVAFDAGNLLPVVRAIRQRFADADIVIFSDRDTEALDSSVGTRKAAEAASAVGARLVVPEWTGQRGRDANDIHAGGFTWGGTTYPGKDILEGCVKFATPYRSPAFMEILRECGITAEDLAPARADAVVESGVPADGVIERARGEVIDPANADPSAPIAMGASGDLYAFWNRENKVELIRASDLFKDAGILRLQDLAYWQTYCAASGATTTGGKYDRTMVGNALMQQSKRAGALAARNVPASVASLEIVEQELNLAMMHAKPSAYAVAKVLMAQPDWRGVVWFNEFAERIEARVNPPCEGGAGRWTDNHDMLLSAWLSAQYGISVSNTMVVAAVGLLAAADKRHPVRDYLNGLVWDGRPRLDTWLNVFAGCEDNTYTGNVGAKTLIGAVARIMMPGVKFDTTLVLEGEQGLKKSTLINALAPNDEWYTDNLEGDLGSKDAAIGLAGKWLIEVPELASLNRTRVEVVKSFLSRRVDDYRSPHAKRNADHPRQCAFFGTINPEADGRYLNDTTGGRRFWPVTCRSTNIEGLKSVRDQLWGEAVARYSDREQWWLTAEVERLAKSEQAERQESNIWAEHVDRFMAHLPPDDRYREWGGPRASRAEEVTTGEIFAAITGKQITKKDLSDSKLIAGALKAAGWVQKRGTKGTGRYWVRS